MKTFFIVGAQRSGTTLLSVMMGQHPEIFMEDRSVAFRLISVFKNAEEVLPYNLEVDRNEFYQWLIRNDYKGRIDALLKTEEIKRFPAVRALIESSISQRLQEHQCTYWADKAPNLQVFLPDLLMLIPDAKIIHIVRDGRANAYSIARRSYQHLLWSAQHWVDMNVAGLINRDLIGADRYHLVLYEQLLQEPEKTLEQVCEFLQLTYSDQMLQWSEGTVAEDKRYVKSTLDTEKIDRYRAEISMRQLRAIERIQGPLLRELGYELISNPAPDDFRPLSLGRQILYHQWSNFKMLFRSEQAGMRDKKNVRIKLPFRNRLYNFLLALSQDLFSRTLVRNIFRRTFYKKRYYQKDAP